MNTTLRETPALILPIAPVRHSKLFFTLVSLAAASLVTDVGWYATVPENTVAMVRPEAELEDIQHHLAEFLRDPGAYRTLGTNGRRYVEEHHTVEGYVRGLLEMVQRTLTARSRQVASWMTARAGRAIQPWFAEDAAGLLLANPAEAIQQLADGRGR